MKVETNMLEAESKNNWYAIHTRSKSEKIAQRYFDKMGINAYVPTIRRTKEYSRKIKHYDIPIINCYCFVNIHPDQRIEVLKNPFALQFLMIGREIYPIPEEEINILKRVTGELMVIEAQRVNHFQVGDEVEVVSGQLTGLRGYIVEVEGKKNLVIELTHIGFQLRLHIDPVHLYKDRTFTT